MKKKSILAALPLLSLLTVPAIVSSCKTNAPQSDTNNQNPSKPDTSDKPNSNQNNSSSSESDSNNSSNNNDGNNNSSNPGNQNHSDSPSETYLQGLNLLKELKIDTDYTYPTNADDAEIIKKYKLNEPKYLARVLGIISTYTGLDFKDIYNKILAKVPANFNEKAAADKMAYLADSLIKNFSLVDKDNNLILNPLGQSIKLAPDAADAAPMDRGKPRFLANDKYKNAVLQSYSIIINNSNDLLTQENSGTVNGRIYFGTAWILDYKLEPNQTYPTKWYLATNLHVALSLKKQFDAASHQQYKNEPRVQEEANELKAAYKQVKSLEAKYFAKQNEIKEEERNKGQTERYNELNAELQEILKEYSAANAKYKALENSFMGETKSISLYHFNTETPLNTELQVTNRSPYVNHVNLEPSQVNIVYAATNFLNQSPSQYLGNNDFHNLEEMADFAVLEIDFSKQTANSKGTYTLNGETRYNDEEFTTREALAKAITSDFANWNEADKGKPANFDLNEKYFDLIKEKVSINYNGKPIQTSQSNLNYIAVGFPVASTDYNIQEGSLNDIDRENLKYTTSLWTNKSNAKNRGVAELGNTLTRSYAMQNMVNKPGLTDIMITAPIINNKTGFDLGNFKDVNDSSYQLGEYINYGLGYNLASWQPLTGASGSSVRDINNNIIGINYASGDQLGNSLVSIVQALRSSGNSYNDFYGKYKLAQYDLIYGGGVDQRDSYRQALARYVNDSSYQTYLFSDINNIPEQYKFVSSTNN
ncbi:Ig-specific serine endopeptidase MIP [Metamycoplasma neophronis]|uniref:DUF31 domain-containing protein n=1 Tax=Metamycoplasma neophronis TaxID=872983 RepID=A0ABY2Z0Y3_9BACT|nr:DUF31 family protein [Metamycoplasma neophronis]TPR54058.1 hypothetical protein FJR74_01285 [Metamycoplasma neophronis]